MNGLRIVTACSAMALASVVALAPASAAFAINNTNGGDGFVLGDSTSFRLFGSNNGSGDNLTGYTDTALKTQSYKAAYTYTTFDLGGAFYDPAGYYLNGALLRLSPLLSSVGDSFSSVLRFRVNAGDTYGFYVTTPDGLFGRGEIAATIASDVPETSSWIMLLAGFGIVGATLRRHRGQRLATV